MAANPNNLLFIVIIIGILIVQVMGNGYSILNLLKVMIMIIIIYSFIILFQAKQFLSFLIYKLNITIPPAFHQTGY